MDKYGRALILLVLISYNLTASRAEKKSFQLDSLLTLNCSSNWKLNITNIDIQETSTTCVRTHSATCSLSNADNAYIKDNCHNESSCSIDLSKLNVHSSCSRHFGYLHVSYFCERKVMICHFEDNDCGFNVPKNNYYIWKRVKDTTGAFGMYLSVNCIYSPFKNCELYSPPIVPSSKQCLYFWYKGDSLKLSWVEKNDVNKNSLSWNPTKRNYINWQQVEVDLSHITSQYQLLFEAVSSEEIGIDDVSVFNLPCEEIDHSTRSTGNYSDCKITPEGKEYRGRIDQTLENSKCIPWNSEYPHRRNIHSMDDQENYCRNPDSSIDGPWCYTANNRYGFCDVPFCGQSLNCLYAAERLQLIECSAHYLKQQKIKVSLAGQLNICLNLSSIIENKIRQTCIATNEIEICEVNLSKFLQNLTECFPQTAIMVEYACEEIKHTVTATSATSLSSSTRELTGNSIDMATTTQKVRTRHQETVVESNLTEIIAGVSAGLVLLGSGIGFIYCIVKRSKDKVVRRDNTRQILENDYVGTQSINLPNYKLYYNMDETGFNSPVYATHNHSFDIDRETDFDDMNVREINNFYGIVEYGQIEKSEKRKGRNELPQRQKMKNDDIYADSEEDTYDVSNNVRHKEVDNNLYGHAVDLVYDTSSHVRKTDNDETYDHFHGQ